MIFNLVGGGNGTYSRPFAMVIVNYPSGSTITNATNVFGYEDIRPSSASAPQRLYYVNAPASGTTQSCTFASTDSTDPTKTKTTTVEDITIGTSQTITLSYRLYLYSIDETDRKCTDVTGGWTCLVGASEDSSGIHLAVASSTVRAEAHTVNSISLQTDGYSTLHIVYSSATMSSSNVGYCVGTRSAVPQGRPSSGTESAITAGFTAYAYHSGASAFTTLEDTITVSTIASGYIEAALNHFDTSKSGTIVITHIYAE